MTLVGVIQMAAELRFRLVPLVGVVHMRLVWLVDAFMLSTSNAGGCNAWAISTASGCIYLTGI